MSRGAFGGLLGQAAAAVVSVFKYSAGDSIASGYTFARALAAYQLSSGGVWGSVATGTARDAHYIGAVRTLLLEQSRKNYLLNTNNLANASWSAGSSVVGPPVATAAQAADPAGTAAAAAKIALTATSGGGAFSVMSQNPAGQAATAKALSIYYQGAVGGEQTYLNSTPDGSAYTRVLLTATTSWQMAWVLTSTSNSQYCQFGCDLRDASESAKAAANVFATWAQLENGSYPSSPIVNTTTAQTRPADVLTYTVPGGAGQVGTLYEKFYDLSTGSPVFTEQVSALTTSTTFVPATGRAWIAWKFALGTQSLAAMQAAT